MSNAAIYYTVCQFGFDAFHSPSSHKCNERPCCDHCIAASQLATPDSSILSNGQCIHCTAHVGLSCHECICIDCLRFSVIVCHLYSNFMFPVSLVLFYYYLNVFIFEFAISLVSFLCVSWFLKSRQRTEKPVAGTLTRTQIKKYCPFQIHGQLET